jgi:hypothetical protein
VLQKYELAAGGMLVMQIGYSNKKVPQVGKTSKNKRPPTRDWIFT